MTAQEWRDIRRSKGLTITDLSREARVAINTIRRLEAGVGVPHQSTLDRLCDALGIERVRR